MYRHAERKITLLTEYKNLGAKEEEIEKGMEKLQIIYLELMSILRPVIEV